MTPKAADRGLDLRIVFRADGKEIASAAAEGRDYHLVIGQTGERTRISIVPERPLTLLQASLRFKAEFRKDDWFFVNGYQSWTDTREFNMQEPLRSLKQIPAVIRERYHFAAYGDAWFRSYRRPALHGFTLAYRKRADGETDLIGSYNEENAFLVITYHRDRGEIVLESDCEGRTIDGEFPLFDFVRYRGGAREVLDRYFSAYGGCTAPPVRGYTSWYLYYQDIDEKKMRDSLQGIDSSQFDLFQIDDGYETFVGDWLDIDPQKFPNGLEPILGEIRGKGLTAGIWLAPFVCETKSRLFREHPDWLYREGGQPVFAGCNWSGDVVLDIRKPEVLDYIRTCLRFYKDMGFTFFKLDFLYAAALIRDERYTRAEIMRMAMRELRDILPDSLILGCGVPLSSAFGLVDYCRIGPDVSLDFDDTIFMRFLHRERISTKHTIPNTIYRSCMDGRVFRCDPDVFLLRDEEIRLTKEQRRALVMINYLCGAVYMTSDRVGTYDEEKKAVLREAERLAGAEVTQIETKGTEIRIGYRQDGRERELVYDRRKGAVIHG